MDQDINAKKKKKIVVHIKNSHMIFKKSKSNREGMSYEIFYIFYR